MLRKLINFLLVPKEVTIVRLDPAVLLDLKRKVGATCIVTSQTTEHQAGYQLGVQHVLNVLQEGYTISRT